MHYVVIRHIEGSFIKEITGKIKKLHVQCTIWNSKTSTLLFLIEMLLTEKKISLDNQ